MVNLNRQIRCTQARQGGFSAHVLPGDVGYQPTSPWGMGWLHMEASIAGDFYDTWELTCVSGDGSVSASFTMDTGTAGVPPAALSIYPVDNSTFVVAFRWQISKGNFGTNAGDSSQIHITSNLANVWFGIGKKGFLVSNTTAALIDTPESLGPVSVAGAWPVGGWDGAQAETALNYTGSDQWCAVNSHNNRNGNPEFGTGATAYAETNDGTQYRISLAADSGFDGAVDNFAAINSADEGSVWHPNYASWDSRPFKLDAKPSGGEWATLPGGVSLVGTPVSVGTPDWVGVDSFDFEYVNERFLCLVSVPYSDRRAWFQSEHGMTIA